MNIIYSVNNNYSHYLFNSVLSLVSSTNRRDINLYILYTELDGNFKNKFRDFFTVFGLEIHFIEINENHLKNYTYKVDERISLEAYYRLFIADVISPSESRALYLDCDTIINAPIEQLYEQDLQGKVIGAVEDILRFSKNFNQFIKNLTLTNHNYFNSGLLLIDLNLWRAYNISEKCMYFLTNNEEKIVYHDQDVLNAVLNLHWLELDLSWNVQSHFVLAMERYQNCFENAKIIHYLGLKPDEENCIHPLKEYYFIYDRFLKSKQLI